MKLHLPVCLLKWVALAFCMTQPILAVNDLGVEYGGNTYAGDFSFSFTLKEGQLGSSDVSDVLALYWNVFDSSRDDYFNAFTLNYTSGGIYLSVGEGNVENAGTSDAPEITESTIFTANTDSDRSATFSTALTVGEIYTIKNTGANKNQTVTLWDSFGTQLGSVSYNGNMNGNATIMSSLFNFAYSPDPEVVEIWNASSLRESSAVTGGRQILYRVCDDVEFTSLSDDAGWTSESPLLSGGVLSFESSGESAAYSLAFRNGDSTAISGAGSLEFRKLKSLIFDSIEGGAVSGIDNLLISGVNDGVADTADVRFLSNSVGGGIAAVSATLENNGNIEFSGNQSTVGDGIGGAIQASSDLTIKGNADVNFLNNSARSGGGAIYCGGEVAISDNGNVNFEGNYTSSSSSCGGAINADKVTITNNADVSFTGNRAGDGGAIYAGYGAVVISNNNGNVLFQKNASSDSGGAIYVHEGSVTISENQNVTFTENEGSYGCAIRIYLAGNVSITDNKEVTFSKNAGLSTLQATTALISGNDAVRFESNTGGSNGVMWATYLTIKNNGSVDFIGNSAVSDSGAIYTGRSLSITGNDNVTFRGNYENYGGNYRLRGIYQSIYCTSMTLSAKSDRNITFYDSVYSGAATVKFNESYTDAEGNTQKAEGDIIFSGATTEDDLKTAKNDVAGTEEEILNSRTSEINSEATLYGGTLQVQDKAVLKLNGGLTVSEGSNASVKVKAAELSVGSHALSMVSGSSLSLADEAKVTATELTITTGATLAVLGSVSTEPLTEQVSALTLSDETVAGFDASRAVNTGSVSVLEGDLTLESGSLLSLDDAYLELTGDLDFAVAEGEEKIALDIAPGIITESSNQVVLFNVGGVVTFGYDALTTTADDGLVYIVKATDYFTGNGMKESTKLVYDSSTGVVYLEDEASVAVPEPATATLSLLALAAIAARRRRK